MTVRTILSRLLRRDRRAVAAVEMALVTTVIVIPLCSFSTEAGQALLTQYKLSRGLHAGLIFAWSAEATSTPALIQSNALNGFQNSAAGTYGSNTATATATFSYYCIDPTTGIHGTSTVASNTTACSGSQVNATWVTLTLTTSIPTIFPVYKGSASWPLSVSGMVRTR